VKPAKPTASKPAEPLTKMTAPPKPEVPKPAGNEGPKQPMIDVDAELAKIRATDPPEFPQPAAEACGAKEERSEWTIANSTSAPLLILIRGAEKQAITIEPGKTATIHLLPGKYEVAGRLDLDTITPFYGMQEFAKGSRYRSRFRIELQ
jgi:hypothetical protein